MHSISHAYAGLMALISTPQDPSDTRLLSQAAVSANHVAFAYAEDLWICARDGTGVRHP